MYRVPFAILTAALLVTAWTLSRSWSLASGGLVESYPYFWPDGIDWIDNGLYLLDHIVRGIPRDPPSIRQPFFPSIIALSYALEEPRVILAGIHAAWGVVLVTTYLIARELQISSIASSLLLLSIAANHSLNSFRLYVMSDTICMAFMLMATLWYIKDFRRSAPTSRPMVVAAVCAAVAGACQVYGYIPAISYSLLIGSCALYERFVRSGSKAFRQHAYKAVANTLIVATPLVIWLLWRQSHFGSAFATSIRHFSLLELTLRNVLFYEHVLPILLAPALLAALLCFRPRRSARQSALLDSSAVFLLLVSVSFCTLTFLYQWAESRFTVNYLVFPFLFSFVFIDRLYQPAARHVLLKFVVACVVTYTSAMPTGNLMIPKVPDYLERLVEPHRYSSDIALIELSKRLPTDRRLDPCLLRDHGRVTADPKCEPYIYPKLANYLNRAAEQSKVPEVAKKD